MAPTARGSCRPPSMRPRVDGFPVARGLPCDVKVIGPPGNNPIISRLPH